MGMALRRRPWIEPMARWVTASAARKSSLSNVQKLPAFLSQNALSSSQTRCLSRVSQGFAKTSRNSSRGISLTSLLQRYGFPQPRIHDFLTKNQFLLSLHSEDVEKSLKILSSFKLPQKWVVSILCACPSLLELEFMRKWETVFHGLGISRISPVLIQSVLEHCRRFQVEPTNLTSCLWKLRNLGFSIETLTRVLEEFPSVISMDSPDLGQTIDFLKGLGILLEEIDSICYLFPRVFGRGTGDRLKQLIDEFQDLGFMADEIRREIIRNPQILSMEVGELSRCFQLLRTLKCRLVIKERILSKGYLRAGFEVKLRVDCLCRHGLIRREAFKVLQREPRLLIYEIKDIEKKIEFLTQRIGFDIGSLIDVPEYLGVSFERQILPRYNVINYLRLNGGLGCEVGLKDMIKPSTRRFWNLYVRPYPECETIFGRFSKELQVKNQHPPVGLWKLFKPQSYLETQDDLRNMKLFMESMA